MCYIFLNFHSTSVSALTRDLLVDVSFSTNGCVTQDKFTLKKIGNAELLYGLYVFKLGNTLDLQSTICAVSHDNTFLWHQRLGHPSVDVLKSLQDMLQLKSFNFHSCTTCPLAKQRRLSFSSNNRVSPNPCTYMYKLSSLFINKVSEIFLLFSVNIWLLILS